MSLLYNIEGEVAIEMSQAAWEQVEEAVLNYLAEYEEAIGRIERCAELEIFANKVRSHLQHLEAEKVSPPPNNLDLI